MSAGNVKRKQRQRPLPAPPQAKLEQLRMDLAGLERLHALQSLLIRELRKQVDALESGPRKQ